VAALDIRIAGTVTPERGDGARKANIHAQDARSPSVVFRVEAEATPDRRSANVSQSTVHEYVERFRAAGLNWPLPAEMSESDLEGKLYPDDSSVSRPGAKNPPDFAYIHQELQGHKHTTLQLLWEEYRAGDADGYGYSRFWSGPQI